MEGEEDVNLIEDCCSYWADTLSRVFNGTFDYPVS